MPALYTHYKFGNEVLNNLYKKQKENIASSIEYYNMFNQGFDNLYYYHIKWNYYKNLGIKAHKKDIDIFFKNIFEFIMSNNLQNDYDITNIIYGYINHYTLDTLIHPFINYQVANLNIPHTKIEFMLDAYLFNETKQKWKNKIYKTLIPKLKFNTDLYDLLDYTFLNTYNEKNIGKIFNSSHNNGYYIYRYFINDNYNIKSTLYKIVDFVINKDFKLHQNTFNINKVDIRILNKGKEIWHHPNKINETHNYSLDEIYKYALKIAVKLNKEAYNILNNKYPLENFLKEIKEININNMN